MTFYCYDILFIFVKADKTSRTCCASVTSIGFSPICTKRLIPLIIEISNGEHRAENCSNSFRIGVYHATYLDQLQP